MTVAGSLEALSRKEMEQLKGGADAKLHKIMLAVFNTGIRALNLPRKPRVDAWRKSRHNNVSQLKSVENTNSSRSVFTAFAKLVSRYRGNVHFLVVGAGDQLPCRAEVPSMK